MTEPCGQPVLSEKRQFDGDKPSPVYVSYSVAAKATHLPPLSLSEVLFRRRQREHMCILMSVFFFSVYDRGRQNACVYLCVCVCCVRIYERLLKTFFYSEAHCSR